LLSVQEKQLLMETQGELKIIRCISRLLLPVLAPALLAAIPRTSSAQDITLDFEGLPSMTYFTGNFVPPEARLSDQYLATYGVRFSSVTDYVAVIDLGGGHATSGTNGIGGVLADDILDYSQAAPITFSFFDPANPARKATTDFFSLRGDFWGGGNTALIEAFDIHGDLIGSDAQPDVGGQVYSLSLPGIHSVRYSGVELLPDGSGGIGLDDVRFNRVSSVPEPAGIALLIGWLIPGIAFWRKHNKARR
jgi:hypothetical protein